MLPLWTAEGTLPPGEHEATWAECVDRFGWNLHRRWLLLGLLEALRNLRDAGCPQVFLDGSFVTNKEVPGDYDGCWDWQGVDLSRLDPVFLDPADLRAGRPQQKAKYRGEMFPSHWTADPTSGRPYRQFFQHVKYTDEPKGIVVIDLMTGGIPA